MEDIMEVYHRPEDPKRPLICLDEASVQLLGEVREPLPMRPGAPLCVDSEYKREGVESYFMLMAPLLGWRHVELTGTRTKVDYAGVLKTLDEKFPDAEKIVIVQDNLNTHRAAALYEEFEPQEARRLVERFEFHYTPKHGSWLNMAEIELGILKRQCLGRRIATTAELTSQIAAWQTIRNKAASPYDWQFTTSDARIKLKRLYPAIKD
jgi:transposase